MLVFTIGNTKNYTKALNENPPESCIKIGRTEDYQGGWVWLTKEEAQNFIDSEDFPKIDWGDGKLRCPKDFQPFGYRHQVECATANLHSDMVRKVVKHQHYV